MGLLPLSDAGHSFDQANNDFFQYFTRQTWFSRNYLLRYTLKTSPIVLAQCLRFIEVIVLAPWNIWFSIRPVSSLGHQEGRRFFWEGPKFFELCPIVLHYVQQFFQGGFSPLVTGLFSITVTYLSSCSFMCLCVPCYCHACFSLLRCVWEWRRYTITPNIVMHKSTAIAHACFK